MQLLRRNQKSILNRKYVYISTNLKDSTIIESNKTITYLSRDFKRCRLTSFNIKSVRFVLYIHFSTSECKSILIQKHKVLGSANKTYNRLIYGGHFNTQLLHSNYVEGL